MKGQLQIGFNWVFILIAGAVILLFFAGIVVKQKDISDRSLAQDVVGTMDSIFTAARVADKTRNVIPLRGLSDFAFEFGCSEGVSTVSLEGKPFQEENTVDPLFAPSRVKGTHLFLLSLPYNFPYKVSDFLMLSSPSIQYVVVGKTDIAFIEEFLNQTEGLNVDYAPSAKFTVDGIGSVRVVDLDGSTIISGGTVPEALFDVADEFVSGVSISIAGIQYYRKEGNKWVGLHNDILPLFSLKGKRDAAKYAAIFADNDEYYWCTMQKVFKRISFVNKVYLAKLKEMEEYYSSKEKVVCVQQVKDLAVAVEAHQSLAEICTREQCDGLLEQAKKIKTLNEGLQQGVTTCEVQLY